MDGGDPTLTFINPNGADAALTDTWLLLAAPSSAAPTGQAGLVFPGEGRLPAPSEIAPLPVDSPSNPVGVGRTIRLGATNIRKNNIESGHVECATAESLTPLAIPAPSPSVGPTATPAPASAPPTGNEDAAGTPGGASHLCCPGARPDGPRFVPPPGAYFGTGTPGAAIASMLGASSAGRGSMPSAVLGIGAPASRGAMLLHPPGEPWQKMGASVSLLGVGLKPPPGGGGHFLASARRCTGGARGTTFRRSWDYGHNSRGCGACAPA